MKALTVRQPWAQEIMLNIKVYEFRSWHPTDAISPGDRLAIHSAARWEPGALRNCNLGSESGVILGTVIYQGWERKDSPWGRYAWSLAQPILLPEPIPAKGRLGLWTLTGAQEEAVRESVPNLARASFTITNAKTISVIFTRDGRVAIHDPQDPQ